MKTAYPQTHTPCAIRLYSNIPFDNTYKNHSMISSTFKYNNSSLYTGSDKNFKERFIDRRDYTRTGNPYYYPRYDLTGEFNFNFTNGLVGSVVLELNAEQTNANYLRLRTGTSASDYEYYYYFITSISQVNADTYTLSLELDVLMTYQDEFLDGMKDVPVFTQRKHSYRFSPDGLVPYCADLKTGEDAFTNVKPNIISDVIKFIYENEDMRKIKDVLWLYICIDNELSGVDVELAKFIYNNMPLTMLAIPINVDKVIYQKLDNTCVAIYDKNNIFNALNNLIGDGKVHGAKISPYPPFSITSSADGGLGRSGGEVYIGSNNVSTIGTSGLSTLYKMGIGGNVLYYATGTSVGATTLEKLMLNGCVVISQQDKCYYPYDGLTLGDLKLTNTSKPSIYSDRFDEPKTKVAPFRKYVLNAQYSSNGCEFYPEIGLSQTLYGSNTKEFNFVTIATGYIGDNNMFTYLSYSGIAYSNYNYEKIGLATPINYICPCGENALDVFNSTQAQSFYQSKTASGITSGLTIAGGVASVGLGIAGAVGTLGMSSVASAGLIAGGVASIGGGIASMVNTVKSVDAKMEDLKNTPDSINVSGSNFFTDDAITKGMGIVNYSYHMPYLTIYECSPIILENANEFFYNYGYQVARECYFNQELKYKTSVSFQPAIDNNLFGRTIFNYIQLNEDITNKLNVNIPYLIKQKLSSLFNNGITLWTFFNFNELWAETPSVPSSSDYIDKWFMKCKYDNSEIDYMMP